MDAKNIKQYQKKVSTQMNAVDVCVVGFDKAIEEYQNSASADVSILDFRVMGNGLTVIGLVAVVLIWLLQAAVVLRPTTRR